MGAFGALVTGSALAGAAYLYLEIQKEQGGNVQPVAYTPEPENKPGYGKASLFAPLLELGVTELVNRSKSSNKTSGLGDFLDGLFGGGKKQPGTKPGKSSGWVKPASVSRPVAPSTGGIEGRLLGLIGGIEAPQGYDQVYGGSKIQPPRPITTMTVGEVLAWQDKSVRAGSKSSAAGRYQIIRSTLRSLVSRGHVRTSDTFSRSTQDRLGTVLLKRRGLDDYKAGKISKYQFGQNLSKEWASLPAISKDKRGRTADGQSYYAGDGLNHALTTRSRLMNAILGGSA